MDQDLVEDITSKQILHWNARNLIELPLELLHFGSRTEEIYLRWNNIYTMPSWFGVALESLTNLYLEFNKLSDLPNDLSKLQNLHTLHLDSNNFSCIPKTIYTIFKLRCLKMSRNLIESVGKEISKLSNLELLDLSYNMLKILPPEIADCKDLREVYLNNNDILFLPKVMTHMPKLEFLEISSNLLHFLPATPFLSRPAIHIGYNHKLNWGSIQALQQNLLNINYNSPAIDVNNRCNSWIIMQALDGTQWVETACGSVGQKLILPCGLDICSMKVSQVPTLKELAQRCASKTVFQTNADAMEVDGAVILPRAIHKDLEQGPVALCHVCSSAIFRHSYCAIVHSNIAQIPHCLLVFCSRTCAIAYYSS